MEDMFLKGISCNSAELFEPMQPWLDRIVSHWKRQVGRCGDKRSALIVPPRGALT